MAFAPSVACTISFSRDLGLCRLTAVHSRGGGSARRNIQILPPRLCRDASAARVRRQRIDIAVVDWSGCRYQDAIGIQVLTVRLVECLFINPSSWSPEACCRCFLLLECYSPARLAVCAGLVQLEHTLLNRTARDRRMCQVVSRRNLPREDGDMACIWSSSSAQGFGGIVLVFEGRESDLCVNSLCLG